MKKILYLIAAAALLLPACSKNVEPAVGTRTIAFQAANYATKVGISGTIFPRTESFGVYAWTDNTTGPYFMDNEVVSYQEDGLWKTETPYFWPITQAVDFFCFYPSRMTELTAEKTKVTYSAYDVEAAYGKDELAQDVMYADKAANFADYPDRVPGSASGFSGVPSIFRHALAKLSAEVSLAYNHKEEADGTVTDWEITLNSVSLSGIYKKGDCQLVLSDESAVGVVGWTRPEGNVWTNDGSVLAARNYVESAVALAPGEAVAAVPEMMVLPQALAAGQQRISLNVTIKTTRNGEPFLSETVDVAADLCIPEVVESWQMNRSVIYRITVNPTRSTGKDPDDPDKPVDPDDPNLKDVRITFDPAVDGWEMMNVNAVINL